MESKTEMEIKMDVKEIINDTVDKLLFWALNEKRSDIVKHATEVFTKGSESEADMHGFNDWFVHDYRTNDGKSIVDLYRAEHELAEGEIEALKSISESVYSAFERMPIKDKMVIKDLFTKSDYLLNEVFDAASVMLVRVYKLEGKHVIVEPPEFMSDEYKTLLVKGMLEKYNEYCRLYAPVQMDVFVKEHSLVLYRFLSIIDNTATEYALDDEDYVVHQSTYVIKNTPEAHGKLKVNENFILSLDDEAGAVFKIVTGEHEDVVAEIVLADDRLEIECTTAEALEYSKNVIEEILGENATHLRDEVLNIDDLIG